MKKWKKKKKKNEPVHKKINKVCVIVSELTFACLIH